MIKENATHQKRRSLGIKEDYQARQARLDR
jgi:hypothetical protein